MRGFFGLNDMENYQGDLADVVRSGGRRLAQPDAPLSSWDFPADTINVSSTMEENRESIFGDLFYDMRDPLLHELNMAGSDYFWSTRNNSTDMLSTSVEDTSVILAHHHRHRHRHKVFEEEMNTSPSNIFSRIQISPNNPTKFPVSSRDTSPPVMSAASPPRGYISPSAAVVSSDMITSYSSKGCLIENTGQVQISSPRNPGIKRRKSQAKKVICIPAPAAASSRPGGEVVPSDLWAWRKYGQKPIKGSPYPRGYYRCSSSKGCSARKQVERSRTDPNMLVITYTSEHNHPWPTQRNALAGSTRSQPPKNNNAGGSKSLPTYQVQETITSRNTKEEQKESSDDILSPTIAAAAGSCSTALKEETEESEKQMEMDDNEYSTEGLPQSYRPEMPGSGQSEDFFADLEEIEADPLDLLFTQGYTSEDHRQKESSKVLDDPFSLFDWSASSGDNSSSFGEAKGSL